MAGPTPDFHLRITYIGLCFFVADATDPAAPLMRALMLNPLKMAPSMEEHVAHIYFDRAQLTQYSPLPAGGTPEHRDFSGCLDLPAHANVIAASDRRVLALPPAVPDVNTICSGVVDKTLACSGPSAQVPAMVTMSSGFVSDYAASGPWNLHGSSNVYLTWKISWLIPCSGDRFDLNSGGTTDTLYPIDRLVQICVKNVPLGEQGPDDAPYALPTKMSQMHFKAFYGMYAKGASVTEVPTPGFVVAPILKAHPESSYITCASGGGGI